MGRTEKNLKHVLVKILKYEKIVKKYPLLNEHGSENGAIHDEKRLAETYEQCRDYNVYCY